jgi:hypothetical protein
VIEVPRVDRECGDNRARGHARHDEENGRQAEQITEDAAE